MRWMTSGRSGKPRYRWHLGCILPRVPAISLRTGREKSWVDKGFIPPVVTFNETLEWIRQMHLISGGMPQIVYLVGWCDSVARLPLRALCLCWFVPG